MEKPSESDNYNPEEELIDVGNWKIVDLKKKEEQETENKTELFKARTKIYRINNGEWQERGLGNLVIIRNEDDKRIRVVHTQE